MGGRGEKLYAVMCRNAMAAENKAGGKLSNHVSTKAYKVVDAAHDSGCFHI